MSLHVATFHYIMSLPDVAESVPRDNSELRWSPNDSSGQPRLAAIDGLLRGGAGRVKVAVDYGERRIFQGALSWGGVDGYAVVLTAEHREGGVGWGIDAVLDSFPPHRHLHRVGPGERSVVYVCSKQCWW